MKRLNKWPQNNTMVKPENHIVYGPCPFYLYCADNWPRNENEKFENWMNPDENYVGYKKSKKRLVKRIPLQQHVWYGPYWWGDWGYDNYYGYSDYGATDSSSDTSGGEWDGSDIGIGGDFGGCEGKRKLHKLSDTDNIHEISQSDSENVFQSLLNDLIEDGYKWLLNREIGCFGCLGYQLPPIGVQEPIIYLLEEFCLIKNNKQKIIVVEHHYDTNGTIVNSSYKSFNEPWKKIYDEIKNNTYKLNDGNTFIYTDKKNYQETKDFVNNEIEKRNQQLID